MIFETKEDKTSVKLRLAILTKQYTFLQNEIVSLRTLASMSNEKEERRHSIVADILEVRLSYIEQEIKKCIKYLEEQKAREKEALKKKFTVIQGGRSHGI